MPVILRTLLLRPEDLDVPREALQVLCANAKLRVWHATFKTATREVKAAQSTVKLGWFGLLVVLLGRFPTGSSVLTPNSHEPYCIYHFALLCTTSYL